MNRSILIAANSLCGLPPGKGETQGNRVKSGMQRCLSTPVKHQATPILLSVPAWG